MKEIKREEEEDKDKEVDCTKSWKKMLRSEKVKKMRDTVMVKIEL